MFCSKKPPTTLQSASRSPCFCHPCSSKTLCSFHISLQPYQFGITRTQRKSADIPSRVSIYWLRDIRCTAWDHRVVDLVSLLCRSLSMLHRLEELDLGNNELYSLVRWLLSLEFGERSRKNLLFSSSSCNLRSRESSFHLLSHSWRRNICFELWFYVLRPFKRSTIHWQIEQG